MMTMPSIDYLDVLRTDGEALLAAARLDLDAPVPGCPGWRNRRLLSHVTRLLGRTADHVATGSLDAPVTPPRPPDDDAGLVAAYASALAAACDALSADPALQAWSPFPGPTRTVAFWRRRLTHEIVVHRFDAEQATGTPSPIPAGVAADGVDEALGFLLPMARAAASDPGPDGSVHVHLTDVPGEWLVRLAGPDVEVTRGHAKGDGVLRGPAAAVLLALWGRVPLDGPDLTVIGDVALVAAARPAV